jgi:hypothetical protein
MKKVILVLILLLWVSSAAYGLDKSKHIGFSVWGGGVSSMGGSYDAKDNLSDVVRTYGFPAGELKYIIIDKIALGVNVGYIYQPFKKEKKPENITEDVTPALNMPFVSLNGTFNFGPFIKSEENKFNPFVDLGGGIYSWYFAKNERTEKLPAPADTTQQFKASSFGINFGGGAEYFVTKKFSVFGRVNYHLVMMKDEKKFGEDFGNQGFLTFGAGVTLYLFTGKQ